MVNPAFPPLENWYMTQAAGPADLGLLPVASGTDPTSFRLLNDPFVFHTERVYTHSRRLAAKPSGRDAYEPFFSPNSDYMISSFGTSVDPAAIARGINTLLQWSLDPDDYFDEEDVDPPTSLAIQAAIEMLSAIEGGKHASRAVLQDLSTSVTLTSVSVSSRGGLTLSFSTADGAIKRNLEIGGNGAIEAVTFVGGKLSSTRLISEARESASFFVVL